MVSFQHPNVMTLVGVCFDGDVPLILMPYMSKGSVLGYVKQNKRELLFGREVNEDSDEVRMYHLLLVCHREPLLLLLAKNY